MMATERQLQFRVGILVLVAASVCVGLVFCFGDMRHIWKKRYSLTIELDNGSGLYSSAPVLLSGLVVGSVRNVALNPAGGVHVVVDVQEDIRLSVDSRAVVSRSLMGETAVEFVRGRGHDMLKPGNHVKGIAAADPLVMLQRLESRTIDTLSAFGETSQEWRELAKNLNNLMDTKQGKLDQVVERLAESLHQFTITMKSANQVIATANKFVSDPDTQEAIADTLASLPKLVSSTKSAVEDTRQVFSSAQQVLSAMNRNLVNLSQVTEPLGKRGEQMVTKVDSSMTKIDQLLTELNTLAKSVNQKDGSLHKFITDPSLYNQLVRSAESLSVLFKQLDPVARDIREFSDKVARNPELLGLGGAIKPSSGLKDEEIRKPSRTSGPAKTQVRGNNY